MVLLSAAALPAGVQNKIVCGQEFSCPHLFWLACGRGPLPGNRPIKKREKGMKQEKMRKDRAEMGRDRLP